jgi:signal peptidase
LRDIRKELNRAAMNLRQQLQQVLSLLYIGTSAFMFWKGLSVLTNSSSPIVVVLSGSMEPAFQRGDVLFLWNRNEKSEVGDIVVYEIQQKPVPIVHRVLREHHNSKKQLLLTKGDNNPVDDLGLYAYGQNYLNKERDIIGTVKGYFPYVGYVTILITENQYFKYGMLGFIGLSTLLSGEE